MMHRSLASVGLVALLAILLFAAAPIAGQAPAPAAKANGPTVLRLSFPTDSNQPVSAFLVL